MTTSFTESWRLNDKPLVIYDQQKQREHPELHDVANSVWCPIGPHPLQARVLMLGRDLDTLATNSPEFHTLTIEAKGTAKNVGKIEMPGLVFLRADPITRRTGRSHENHVFIATFTDRRWLAMRYTTAVNKRYNAVRHEAPYYSTVSDTAATYTDLARFYSGTLNSGALWTLGQIIADLWPTALLGSVPSLVYDSDVEIGTGGNKILAVPPTNIFAQLDSAWLLINRLLAMYAQVIVYDPIADQFTIKHMVQNHNGQWVGNLSGAISSSEVVTTTGLEELHNTHGPAYDFSPVVNRAALYSRSGGGAGFLASDGGAHGSWSDADSQWINGGSLKYSSIAGGTAKFDGTLDVFPTDIMGAPLADEHGVGSGTSPSLGGGTVLASRTRLMMWGRLYTACAWNVADLTPVEHKTYVGLAAGFRPSMMAREITWKSAGDGLVTEVVRMPGIPTEPSQGIRDSQSRAWAPNYNQETRTTPSRPEVWQFVRFDGGSAGDLIGSPVESASLGVGFYRIYSGVVFNPTDDHGVLSVGAGYEPCWIAIPQFASAGSLQVDNNALAIKQITEVPARLVGSYKPSGQSQRPLYHWQPNLPKTYASLLSTSDITASTTVFTSSNSIWWPGDSRGVLTRGTWMIGGRVIYGGGAPGASTPWIVRLVVATAGVAEHHEIDTHTLDPFYVHSRSVRMLGTVNVTTVGSGVMLLAAGSTLVASDFRGYGMFAIRLSL